MLRHHLAFAIFAVAACSSPTGPDNDVASQLHGRLAGTVTIGPN
jgi:hypothetical protein